MNIDNKSTVHVITASGGNGTAIETVDSTMSRQDCEQKGIDLLACTKDKNPEQSGFLFLDNMHFEMAGGEFCGNATRSAAVLVAEKTANTDFGKFTHTVSGYDGDVESRVKKISYNLYYVESKFPNMKPACEDVSKVLGVPAKVVDLGGIVHVVLLEEVFHNKEDYFRSRHSEIVKTLNLSSRDAVGVIWTQKLEKGVKIEPVVWVRSIDTFFYEEACGSGSIAAATVTKHSEITQPTGKVISVTLKEGVVLSGDMEIV